MSRSASSSSSTASPGTAFMPVVCPVCSETLEGTPSQQTKHIGSCLTAASVGDRWKKKRAAAPLRRCAAPLIASPTLWQRPLHEVVAFLDIRQDGASVNEAFGGKLERLGATIQTTLGARVTHVVRGTWGENWGSCCYVSSGGSICFFVVFSTFATQIWKDGRRSTLERAQGRKTPLAVVSPLWADACITQRCLADTTPYQLDVAGLLAANVGGDKEELRSSSKRQPPTPPSFPCISISPYAEADAQATERFCPHENTRAGRGRG